ncbi:MAG: hypothetical protein NVSMB56_00600 [Pyrinomonadaceae bacterium]
MAFFFIIGTRFFKWGSTPTAAALRCGRCGAQQKFIARKGMNFVTLFFIIPVLPISRVKNFVQCPNCGARYPLDAQVGGLR